MEFETKRTFVIIDDVGPATTITAEARDDGNTDVDVYAPLGTDIDAVSVSLIALAAELCSHATLRTTLKHTARALALRVSAERGRESRQNGTSSDDEIPF